MALVSSEGATSKDEEAVRKEWVFGVPGVGMILHLGAPQRGAQSGQQPDQLGRA